jgi:lysozyme
MIPKLGIDVSHWQVNVDWSKAKAAGIEFAFIKATQADNILDPRFRINWEGSSAAGIPRGAYHFYDYRVNPLKQAAWLLGCTQLDPGELGYVLDVEAVKVKPPIKPPATYAEDLHKFCELIEKETDTQPIIYTAYAFWTTYVGPTAAWARQYRLWIANYNNVAPLVPLPWGPDCWTFWQFTDRGPGPVYGVQSKQIDLDLWRY